MTSAIGLLLDLALAATLLVLSFDDRWPVIGVAALVVLVRGALLRGSVRDAHPEPDPLAHHG